MPAKRQPQEKKGTTFVRKTEKLLIKPKIPTGDLIEFETSKGSSQLCTIVVGTTSGVTQIVVHRPLGETSLDKKTDWVISSCEEYKQLNTRLTDPNKGQVNQYRSEVRNKHLIKEAETMNLQIIDGKVMFPKGPRNERVVTARTIAQKLQSGKSEEKKEKKENDPLNPPYLRCLIQEDQLIEKQILKKFNEKDFQKKVEKEVRLKFPAYQTKAGVKADRPQLAIPHLKGMSTSQMGDHFISLIMGDQGEVPAPPPVERKKESQSDGLEDKKDLMTDVIARTHWPKDCEEGDRLKLFAIFGDTLLQMNEEQILDQFVTMKLKELRQQPHTEDDGEEGDDDSDPDDIEDQEFEDSKGIMKPFTAFSPLEQADILKKLETGDS